MKRIVIACAMSLCMVSLAVVVSADTLVLKDGTQVEGTLVSIANRVITFRSRTGVSRRYPISRVDAVEFPSADRATPSASSRSMDSGSDAPPSRARTLEAPAGTELIVRTTDAIDSRDARPNQTFAAIVEQPVNDAAGRMIIPARARASLVIREVSAGSATGSPEMVLDVESIEVDGHVYRVSTTDLSRDSDTGLGQNKRTAEAVGGGAALGGLIGAIAGGGKGAAIGVLVGGAGGAGAQVLTRGSDVRVPAETVLKFTLDKPVTLMPDRSRAGSRQ
jgi:hypothetical protein